MNNQYRARPSQPFLPSHIEGSVGLTSNRNGPVLGSCAHLMRRPLMRPSHISCAVRSCHMRPSHIDRIDRDGMAWNGEAAMEWAAEEFADRDAPKRLRERLVSSWSSSWSSASSPTSSPASSPTLSCASISASNSGSHASGHGGPPSSSDGSCTRRHVVEARAASCQSARSPSSNIRRSRSARRAFLAALSAAALSLASSAAALSAAALSAAVLCAGGCGGGGNDSGGSNVTAITAAEARASGRTAVSGGRPRCSTALSTVSSASAGLCCLPSTAVARPCCSPRSEAFARRSRWSARRLMARSSADIALAVRFSAAAFDAATRCDTAAGCSWRSTPSTPTAASGAPSNRSG